jgi:hypothetical protein
MADEPTETRPEIGADQRPWTIVFIEVAMRAIRRVHYEYGMWGVGRPWEMNSEKALRINMGQGIELADERTVCAAITQEFINSPSVAGLWMKSDGTPEERYFHIDREQRYRTGEKQKVDIFIRKYKRSDNGELTELPFPVFMEAKRARLWQPNLPEGTADKEALQVNEVKADVDKLRKEKNAWQNELNCQLLVWGVYEEDTKDDPYQFFQQVGTGVQIHQLRWLPLKWPVPSADDIRKGEQRFPSVESALWIALAEVPTASGTSEEPDPAEADRASGPRDA